MSLTIFNQGSLPVLERLVQFTEARQKLIAHNIANVSNPYFKPVDVDPKSFQRVMARAVDQRRSSSAPRSTPLDLPAHGPVSFEPSGLRLNPAPSHEGPLAHDENNRDVLKLMQDLAENSLAHNAGLELIRNEMSLLRTAIRGRVG